MKKLINFLTKDITNLPKKVKTVIRIFMCLFLIFIVSITFIPQHLNIDPEFKEFVKVVRHLSNDNLGKNTKRIGFIEEDSSVLGRCNPITNTISINKKHWYTLSKWSKVMLITHEIIHCECKIGHIKGIRWDGCPKSIMYPRDGGEYCNDRYRFEYAKEIQTIRCR